MNTSTPKLTRKDREEIRKQIKGGLMDDVGRVTLDSDIDILLEDAVLILLDELDEKEVDHNGWIDEKEVRDGCSN